jgi:hypothetical protein
MLLIILQQAAAQGGWRDSLQLALVFVGVVGGLIAAGRAVLDFRENLLWKRANAAREFLTEIHQHARASAAVMMMDWYESEHEYKLKPEDDEPVEISYDDVLAALKKEQKDCRGSTSERDRFIRDCFDWFFYFVGRIERYIEIKLIKFEDVEPVFRPYARVINGDASYAKFMDLHEYDSALQFWKRYKNLSPRRCTPTEDPDVKNAPAGK